MTDLSDETKRGPKPKHPALKKSERINVPARLDQKQQIEEAAAAEGKSVAAFILNAVENYLSSDAHKEAVQEIELLFTDFEIEGNLNIVDED